MHCQNCGAVLATGARHCTGCGAPVTPAVAAIKPKNSPLKIGCAALAVVFAVIYVISLLTHGSKPPTYQPDQHATDATEAKLMVYMGCLGFSNSMATKTWKAVKGDAKKALIMTHIVVSGDLDGKTPLSARERACLQKIGL